MFLDNAKTSYLKDHKYEDYWSNEKLRQAFAFPMIQAWGETIERKWIPDRNLNQYTQSEQNKIRRENTKYRIINTLTG